MFHNPSVQGDKRPPDDKGATLDDIVIQVRRVVVSSLRVAHSLVFLSLLLPDTQKR